MDKQEILQKTLQLAERKGWENTSVRDISKAIGYSTIKIYSDFGNKNGLLLEIQKEGFKELKKSYLEAIDNNATPDTNLINLSIAHFHFAQKNSLQYDLMFQLNGAKCDRPSGDILRSTSDPIRELMIQLFGQADRTDFFNWWVITHGFIAIASDNHQINDEEAKKMLTIMVRRFIAAVKQEHNN